MCDPIGGTRCQSFLPSLLHSSAPSSGAEVFPHISSLLGQNKEIKVGIIFHLSDFINLYPTADVILKDFSFKFQPQLM